MSRHGGLFSWTAMVSTHLPHLSQPQARVLALWSYGIAMTRSCGRLTVATFLALLLGQKVATLEQRLYEQQSAKKLLVIKIPALQVCE